MGIWESNTQNTIASLTEDVENGLIDAILHVGDISYADDRLGILNGTLYQGILNYFYNMIQPYASKVPYMTTPGNHESQCNFIDYKARNPMPYQQSGSKDPMYYSFVSRRVQFVMLSTEQFEQEFIALNDAYFNPLGPQYAFAEQTLKEAAQARDRGDIDWIVVAAHKPLYCSFYWVACCWDLCGKTNDSFQWKNLFRINLEPLMVKYGVDLYLTGHTHNYERTLPVMKNVPTNTYSNNVYVNPSAPVHIQSGSPGDTEIMSPRGFIHPAPAWSMKRIQSWDKLYEVPYARAGFGYLNFFNSTTLRFQFIESSDAKVLDEFWIVKK